jgi:uncharacterized protein YukE
VVTVDLPELPGSPAWDERAADELAAAVAAAARTLDEQYGLFDRGWRELLTGWTGPARAAFDDRLATVRAAEAGVRGELDGIGSRLVDAGAEAHERRQAAYYRVAPGLGLAWDVLDRVVG